jgi:hypothetical protein
MNYSIETIGLHKGFCILVFVAQSIVLNLQIWFDELFSVPIKRLSPMEQTFVLLINHPNRRIPITINNYYSILISMRTSNHESFQIWFWKPMLQHCLIKLCPHELLNFDVLKLHVTNHNNHHFIIERIIHMTSHSCLANNTLHMI